ncbi:TPA: hypothetical protein U5E44_002367 [Yersinia enterocolitica]|nr:hypothetical protein [Yersinia enterocolitica]HEN3641546.1 hypothetical protein [Yersinia enterocolitica]
MLDSYFGVGAIPTAEQKKRLLAVQAALEIAKASANAAGANARTDKVEEDLKHASKGVAGLADAIQAALGQ